MLGGVGWQVGGVTLVRGGERRRGEGGRTVRGRRREAFLAFLGQVWEEKGCF